jgi:D-lactate dehydrogenase (cytochrome)
MSLSKKIPSTALLSSFHKTPYPSCRRALGRQIRCESTQSDQPQGHGKSFSGQLYSSTALRLQREKADRDRFSKARNEAGGGKSLALTFGKCS